MKRLVVFFILMSIAVLCFSQERQKRILELKNGTTIPGYVMEQEDGSYLLETEAGDVLFYAADEVRRVSSEAEQNAVSGANSNNTSFSSNSDFGLKRRFFSLTFARTGEDLQPDQVSSSFWKDYRKASNGKKAGMYLMIGGGSLMLTGAILSATLVQYRTTYNWYRYYDDYDNDYDFDYDEELVSEPSPVGSIVALVGTGIAVWGAISFFSGHAKLGRLAKQYNTEHGYYSSLSIEMVPGGLGLTYKF